MKARREGGLLRSSRNIPFFYLYTFLNNFYLDRGIWILFLLSRGFSLTEVGLLEALYHAAALLFEVPTGYVADRFGKRVSLLCGQGLKIVSALLLVAGGSEWLLYTGFLLGAVAGTFLSGATGAWIYETLQESDHESAFKKLNTRLFAVMLVSMGLASPAGGVLAQLRWELLYLCAALLALLSLCVLLMMKDNSSARKSPPDAGVHQASAAAFIPQLGLCLSTLRKQPGLLALVLYGAPLFAATTTAGFYVQLLLENNNISKSVIGSLNGLETWLGAGAGIAAYRVERALGKKGFLTAAAAGCVFCLYGLGFLSFSSGTVMAAFLVMNGMMSMLEPIHEAYMQEVLPSDQRATLMSFFSMLISLCMIVMFFAVSFVADRTGADTALQGLALIWAPCQLWLVWRLIRRTAES